MEKKLKSTSSTMIADSFVFGKMLMKKKHVSWIHEKCHGNFEVPFDHLTYPNTDHYNLVLPEKEKKNLVWPQKLILSQNEVNVRSLVSTDTDLLSRYVFIGDFILQNKWKKTRKITSDWKIWFMFSL